MKKLFVLTVVTLFVVGCKKDKKIEETCFLTKMTSTNPKGYGTIALNNIEFANDGKQYTSATFRRTDTNIVKTYSAIYTSGKLTAISVSENETPILYIQIQLSSNNKLGSFISTDLKDSSQLKSVFTYTSGGLLNNNLNYIQPGPKQSFILLDSVVYNRDSNGKLIDKKIYGDPKETPTTYAEYVYSSCDLPFNDTDHFMNFIWFYVLDEIVEEDKLLLSYIVVSTFGDATHYFGNKITCDDKNKVGTIPNSTLEYKCE